jgi:hypothetical protein
MQPNSDQAGCNGSGIAAPRSAEPEGFLTAVLDRLSAGFAGRAICSVATGPVCSWAMKRWHYEARERYTSGPFATRVSLVMPSSTK